MLSALPPSFPSDPFLGNPFSSFNGGFTPWDFPDLSSSFRPTNPKPMPITNSNSSSGSDEPNPNHAKTKSPSDEPHRTESIMEERKRRRMISNRESARRSRMRKQKHLENIRNQVNRFRIQNREAKNRLQFLLHHSNRVRTENDWLRTEQTMLLQKLSSITQILVLQQLQPSSSAWPCNNS